MRAPRCPLRLVKQNRLVHRQQYWSYDVGLWFPIHSFDSGRVGYGAECGQETAVRNQCHRVEYRYNRKSRQSRLPGSAGYRRSRQSR